MGSRTAAANTSQGKTGRYIFATDDMAEVVARANDIREHDLCVLRGRGEEVLS